MNDHKATIEYDENGCINKVTYTNGSFYEFDIDGHIVHGYMVQQKHEWLGSPNDKWYFSRVNIFNCNKNYIPKKRKG